MKHTLNHWRISASLLLCVNAVGCVGMPHEISTNAAYKTDYVVGREYRLKQSVFVEKSTSLLLVKEGGLQGRPWTIEEYGKEDKKKWPDVMGVLSAGTRLKVKRIDLKTIFQWGDVVWVSATVMDGELAGKVVELRLVSKSVMQKNPSADVACVDPGFLEPIAPEPP